ncbi:hypothetical protein TNCV_3215571 [Trichonephila clavipes]|nr:hypothetical protein TNCV_3215571 [Trichonephila clavipes]
MTCTCDAYSVSQLLFDKSLISKEEKRAYDEERKIEENGQTEKKNFSLNNFPELLNVFETACKLTEESDPKARRSL